MNDPIYLTDVLKRERRKTIGNQARSRYNRSSPQSNNTESHFIASCANFALKYTAKDHEDEDEYGGATADFLHNDFYVDMV